MRTREGWRYLAVVIDLYSRRIVAGQQHTHDGPRTRAGRDPHGRAATHANARQRTHGFIQIKDRNVAAMRGGAFAMSLIVSPV